MPSALAEHPFPHVFRKLGASPSREDDELRGIRRGERRQGERGRVLLARAPGRAVLQQLQPGSADEQHLRVGQFLRQLLDADRAARRRPVDVLDNERP